MAGGTELMNEFDEEMKRVNYLAFCVEVYKNARDLDGKQVYALFSKYALFDYIYDLYEILHVHGTKYMLEELDSYLLSRDRSAAEN
jgi:hypothetical protein